MGRFTRMETYYLPFVICGRIQLQCLLVKEFRASVRNVAMTVHPLAESAGEELLRTAGYYDYPRH